MIGLLPSQTYLAEIPSVIDPQKNTKIQKINDHLNKVVEVTGINIVPIYGATNAVKKDFSYLDYDLFHPNDKGYRLWADTFIDAIK